MRHIGTTSNVFEWWAEQDPERGWGANHHRTVSYDGPNLMVYDRLVAKIIAGGKLVIVKPEDETWGSKQWEARNYARWEWGERNGKLLSMSNFEDPEKSALRLVERIHAHGMSLMRGHGWRTRHHLTRMRELAGDLRSLEEVFDLDNHDHLWTLPRKEILKGGMVKYTYHYKEKYFDSDAHNWVVPTWIVKGNITAQRIINTRNVEIRRLATRHKYGSEEVGYEELIKELNAELVHTDEYGELYHIDAPALPGRKLALVKVVNSTVEEDGTRRTFFLRVHPENRPIWGERRWVNYRSTNTGDPQELTAKNAVASTFGMTGEEYFPEKET